MSTRNIGIVTTWFERGAAYVSRQYEQALSSKHNVFIYARGGRYARGKQEYDKKNVYWGEVTGNPVGAALDIDDLLNWISRNNIDVVLFNEQSWWPPVVECVKRGIVVGAYIDYYTQETMSFFALYDFLICNTRRHYEAFSWHPKAYYVPWGTDVDLFKPGNECAVHDPIVFFHSAGYSPFRKGTDILLRAAVDVRGPFHLVIHTQKDLRTLGSQAIRDARALQDAGLLNVLHKTIPAPGWYSNADVYVYPSRLDGIGLSLPEAISSGLAVIATDHPPMNEFTNCDFAIPLQIAGSQTRTDGYYWDMVEPDCSSLTEAMQEIVIGKLPIRNMKVQARSFAVSSLNWEQRQDDLSHIFGDAARSNLQVDLDNIANQVYLFERRSKSSISRIYMKYPRVIGSILRARKIYLRSRSSKE